MNLVIDVGNSYTKLAVFDDRHLVLVDRCETPHLELGMARITQNVPNLKHAILSSVGRLNAGQMAYLKNEIDVMELTSSTKLPFYNRYATPDTLGVDRMALVSAAILNFPNKNALIIDAGTCITYDFVTDNGNYMGGAISPGLKLRYKSLNDYTANLPLLEPKLPESITGNTTVNSIHSGVVLGICKEIDGIIDDYAKIHRDLTVILTGGDGKFLSKQLKNSIFANSNFLLEGLNFILDHNSN